MAKTRKVSSIFVAPLAVAALSCANEAYALEPTGVDPHEPGITNGIPTGALPPPGVYVVNDLSYIDGSLKGGSGKNSPVGVNVIAWVDVPALVWSTPWHNELVLPALRALLELPFEWVIVSHGEPVHNRAAYERALDLPPWDG